MTQPTSEIDYQTLSAQHIGHTIRVTWRQDNATRDSSIQGRLTQVRHGGGSNYRSTWATIEVGEARQEHELGSASTVEIVG